MRGLLKFATAAALVASLSLSLEARPGRPPPRPPPPHIETQAPRPNPTVRPSGGKMLFWGAATVAVIDGVASGRYYRLGEHVFVPEKMAKPSAEWVLQQSLDPTRMEVWSFIDESAPNEKQLVSAAGGKLHRFEGGKLDLDASMARLRGGTVVVVGHNESGWLVQKRYSEGRPQEEVARWQIAKLRAAAKRNNVHLVLATCRGNTDGGNGFATPIWLGRDAVPAVEALLRGGTLREFYERLGSDDAPYVLSDVDGAPEILRALRESAELQLVTEIVFELANNYPGAPSAGNAKKDEDAPGGTTEIVMLIVLVLGGLAWLASGNKGAGGIPTWRVVEKWSIPASAIEDMPPDLASELHERVSRGEFKFANRDQRRAILEALYAARSRVTPAVSPQRPQHKWPQHAFRPDWVVDSKGNVIWPKR